MKITKEINLKEEESALLDMHSFLNILNVINSELYLLGFFVGDEAIVDKSTNKIQSVASNLKNKENTLSVLQDVENLKKGIRENISEIIHKYPDKKDDPQINESVRNLESIFEVMDVRTTELIERFEKKIEWKDYLIDELKSNFIQVFQAIEKNSKGRYKIVNNIAEHEVKDYLVYLDITSSEGDKIKMPPVLQDIMRDLIANARKYTKPGGRITAGLTNNGEKIVFVVEDTGRGIPENEIQKVVDYGYRAGNVEDKETKGGGFGLTKAYYFVKKYHGQMWIDSKIDEGTKIKISIPVN